MMTAVVNAAGVMANLSKLMDKEIPRAQKQADQDVALEILRLSQLEVPIDEGTLQNSGVVEQVDDGWVIGYHTPYAARLHEHPEYNFRNGRKGKYLEDPILNNLDTLGLKYKNAMEDGIG